MTNDIWSQKGKNKYYEHYRTDNQFKDLRNWVNDAYQKLSEFLDSNFVDNLRNEDFYARLWELEVAEWLQLTGIKMIPTKGKGFDFCLELSTDHKVWIEAVLARADDELEAIQREAIATGKVYNTPRNQTALRYSSVLVGKAEKIKQKYLDRVGEDDTVLIAVSAFAPGAMRSDIDLFMLAILPIEYQVIHFSTDGKPLDNTPRPTHTVQREHAKRSGAMVKKEFLYPGDDFTYINGVLFSEASNLQALLGAWSNGFDQSTNTPHIFQHYRSKPLPEEFTQYFYNHKFKDNMPMVSLEMEEPKKQPN